MTVKPTATATGSIQNTARVAGGGENVSNSSITSNNTDTDTVTVNPPIDLGITKTVGLATSPGTPITTVNQGAQITYTITVTNSTGLNISNATVEDAIEPAIILSNNSVSACSIATVSPSGGGGNTNNKGSCTITTTGNSIIASVNLESGYKASFTVTGKVSDTATGTIPNTAYLKAPTGYVDSNLSNNAGSADINVQAPDLKITKTHTGKFLLNQNDSFTLTVTNIGFASTTGTTTVTDNLPTGLTYVSGGTNWSCSVSGQAVTCTNPNAIASNTSSTITLTVTRTSADAITNTASVSNTSDKNDANNSAADSVSATARLRLVKRITRINTTDTTGFVDGSGDDDNAIYWPTPSNTYLRGMIDGGFVKPGDAVEYTIYFLSDGGTDATNLIICDLVPRDTTFVADTFATGKGIALASSSTSLPTAVTASFSNTADTDNGQFYAPATQPPAACKAPPSFTSPAATIDNVSGAVLVNVVTSPTTLPKATAAGSPSNSYGFIRFRVQVK